MLRAGYSRTASDPSAVASAIARAVERSRPRTRYAVGGGARCLLLVNRLLTDRAFDRFLRLTYRAFGS